MSSIDVAAVCERHRLLFGQSTDGMWWCETADQNPGVAGYETLQSALCALLKARHSVVTWEGIHPFRTGATWWAKADSDRHPLGFEIECAGTELAAVVALADRMPAVCS
jgi:hypothetical protein